MRWAFWPPGTDPSNLGETGDGIWIRYDDDVSVNSESDGEGEEDRVSESGEEEDVDSFSDEEAEGLNGATIGGRFGALALEGSVTDATEEE